MKMLFGIFFGFLLCACSLNAGRPPVDLENEKNLAVKEADRFLVRFDLDAYEENWDELGKIAKAAESREDWIKSIAASRKAVGKIENREMEGSGISENPKDMPPGQYVVVVYASTFSGAVLKERVTLQKESGRWRPIGYFLLRNV